MLTSPVEIQQRLTASIPGFTASRCVPGATRRSLDSAHGRFVPAIPGEDAANYMECVRECRGEGGSAASCHQACQPGTGSGHGSVSGTSDAQALCCMGILAACIGFNANSPFGIVGCMVSALSCTTTPPCNAL